MYYSIVVLVSLYSIPFAVHLRAAPSVAMSARQRIFRGSPKMEVADTDTDRVRKQQSTIYGNKYRLHSQFTSLLLLPRLLLLTNDILQLLRA